jgi:hypothetical protein
MPRIFISHTTSDQRDLKLAHQLAEGIQQQGAKVWIAPESIPAGEEWQKEIAAGILDQCTHFLVILSAASVRKKWVLEEIQLARQRRESDPAFTILPLVVGKIGEYAGSDFTDLFHRIPYHEHFSDQLAAVIAAIKLPPGMPELFRALIEDKTNGFIGREYVFTAIESFLEQHASGYFTIIGAPGIGKSAILAEYVRRIGCVAHFNIRAQGITQTSHFLSNVNKQLRARYGLPHISVPQDPAEGGIFLMQLLNEVGKQLRKDEKLVVAVDALDEVDLTGNSHGANVLYLPPALPNGIYFVMTRRRVSLPLVVQASHDICDLKQFKLESSRDIQAYLRQAIESKQLQAWIAQSDVTADEFVRVLTEKSECNFMYLHYLLPELERSASRNLSLQELPIGLEGYYEDHWRRMGMTVSPLPRIKIHLIYLLAEVGLPISCQKLAEFAGQDGLTVRAVLEEWQQFLQAVNIDGSTKYSLYHTSFRDFLHRRDIVELAGESIKQINAQLGNLLMEKIFGNG